MSFDLAPLGMRPADWWRDIGAKLAAQPDGECTCKLCDHGGGDAPEPIACRGCGAPVTDPRPPLLCADCTPF